MSDRDEGGFAFPRTASAHVLNGGMTLRDWFAGQTAAAVLGGLAAAQVSTPPENASQIAKAAYMLADAMIAERSK